MVRVLEDVANPLPEQLVFPASSPSSSPSTRTEPSVGSSSPLKCFTRVVFPEPFWPRTARNSPRRTLRSTPSSATTPFG